MSAPALRDAPRLRLPLTEFGFGAGPLGGFYGPVDAGMGAAAVDAAWEAGIRYFDVAPLYGHGRAELVLGHALRDRPRDDYVLSTKVGRYLVPAGGAAQPARARPEGAPFNPVADWSRDATMRAIDQSLQRLGVARIDLVYIHDVDAHSQGDDERAARAFAEALDGALPTLLDLKRQGVIHAVGIGLNQVPWALRWLRAAELDAVMIAGRCTLLNIEAQEELLPLCESRGVAVVAAGAFNGGILARGPGSDWRVNYRPAAPEMIERYRLLVELADATFTDLKAAAMQFPLRDRRVTSLVVGMASPDEVRENLRARDTPVPEAFWRGLAELHA